MSDFPLSNATNGMVSSNKGLSAQGLLVQSYCNSITAQPRIDFGDQPNLKPYQTQINDSLAGAGAHAHTYVSTVWPMLLTNTSNMRNYFTLHQAIPDACPSGTSLETWVQMLGAIQEQGRDYVTQIQHASSAMATLRDKLAADSVALSTLVSKLNADLDGDAGMLATVGAEVHRLQANLDATIASTASSALFTMGAAFITAVGRIADFVSAGASTPVVLGGIALVATGIGGTVSTAVEEKKLNDVKAAVLQQEASLRPEVKLAKGVSSAYSSLHDRVSEAATAASAMENAWNLMMSDLGTLISDLKDGKKGVEALRESYVSAANGLLKQVMSDLETLQAQMAGVTPVIASPGQTVGQAIVAAVESSSTK